MALEADGLGVYERVSPLSRQGALLVAFDACWTCSLTPLVCLLLLSKACLLFSLELSFDNSGFLGMHQLLLFCCRDAIQAACQARRDAGSERSLTVFK